MKFLHDLNKRFHIIKNSPLLFLFLIWAYYAISLWTKMLRFENGRLVAGHPWVWADWSMHIPMVMRFAFLPPQEWLTEYPVYAGIKLNYPFFTNFISGMLMRVGLSLPEAMIIPSIVFSLAIPVLMYMLLKQFFISNVARVVAIMLFLFSGGLGFISVLQNPTTKILIQTFSSRYTQMPAQHIEFTNIWMGMLVPQRSFLLGLPIGLAYLYGLISIAQNIIRKKKKMIHPSVKMLVSLGLFGGMLPIMHSHTFFVCVALTLWYCTWHFKTLKQYLPLIIPFSLVALIIFLMFLKPTYKAEHFLSLQLGWASTENLASWIVFWWKNWGIFTPLALVGTVIAFRMKKSEILLFSIPFWLIFIASNIWKFQPQTWDNSKFLAWSYLGLTVPVTFLFDVFLKKWRYGLYISLILFILSTTSGALDVYGMLNTTPQQVTMLSQQQIELGNFVRENTDIHSRFVTSTYPTNPISMFGVRAILLGYPGWPFSYGIQIGERQADINIMFQGGVAAEKLYEKYHVTHILIGQDELSLHPNTQFFKNKYPTIFANEAGTVYQIQKSY